MSMVILSSSLPKSASTLLFQYTQDLVRLTSGNDGQKAFLEAISNGEIEGVGGFVFNLENHTIDTLLSVSKNSGPVVVKTHGKLTPYIIQKIEEGKIKATHIHRDPRDVIISAMDHREKDIKENKKPLFNEFKSIAESLPQLKKFIDNSLTWVQSDKVEVIKYVEVISDPLKVLSSVSEYLCIDLSEPEMQRIIRFREKNPNPLFNKGKLVRFSDEMSDDEISLCNEYFRDEIQNLGYSL